MKLKVKQGSVKYDDTVYAEGQTFDIDESQAKSLLNAGVVEEVKDEVVEDKPKKVKKVKVVKEEKKEKVKQEEVVELEPSLDLTRKELVDYAGSLGIEEADKLGSKEKILEAIQTKKEVKTE